MLTFFALRSDNLVVVNAQSYTVDCSGLDPAIRSVRWSGGIDAHEHVGTVENADAIDDLVTFNDPTPYIALIDAWMTVAAASTLGLGVAKGIKLDLVDALYTLKRQAPIAELGNTWDATDADVAEMTAALQPLLATGFDTLVSQINTTLVGSIDTNVVNPANALAAVIDTDIVGPVNALRDQVNALAASIDANVVNPVNALAAAVDANVVAPVNTLRVHVETDVVDALNTIIGDAVTSGSLDQVLTALASGSTGFSFAPFGHLTAPAATASNVSGGSAAASAVATVTATAFDVAGGAAAATDVSTLSLSLGTVAWVPSGSTATVTLTGEQLATIAAAISARTQTLKALRNAKNNAINACGTVAAVIAADPTSGW